MFKITAEEKSWLLRKRVLAKNKSWVSIAKKIVKDGQMVYINMNTLETSEEKKKGMTAFDVTTAKMLVQIVDNLSGKTKKKYTSEPLKKAIDLGWKLTK